MMSVLDYNTLHGTPGVPLTYIGCDTTFECTVTPTTVTFRYAELRENIPGEDWQWPDGTDDSWPAGLEPWTVDGDNKASDHCVLANCFRSLLWNGDEYESEAITVRVPEEYKNESDVWTSWLPDETHPFEFRAVDQYGRASLSATNQAFGSWQRPYHY